MIRGIVINVCFFSASSISNHTPNSGFFPFNNLLSMASSVSNIGIPNIIIGIINDVSLEIAVELVKTQKTVREILDFEEGT